MSGEDRGNLPLGLDDETEYQNFEVQLGRGDLVVFYTDALIEAADSSGKLLGEAGFARTPLVDLTSGTGVPQRSARHF